MLSDMQTEKHKKNTSRIGNHPLLLVFFCLIFILLKNYSDYIIY